MSCTMVCSIRQRTDLAAVDEIDRPFALVNVSFIFVPIQSINHFSQCESTISATDDGDDDDDGCAVFTHSRV